MNVSIFLIRELKTEINLASTQMAADIKGCQWMVTRGPHGGKLCGKETVAGEVACEHHKNYMINKSGGICVGQGCANKLPCAVHPQVFKTCFKCKTRIDLAEDYCLAHAKAVPLQVLKQ